MRFEYTKLSPRVSQVRANFYFAYFNFKFNLPAATSAEQGEVEE